MNAQLFPFQQAGAEFLALVGRGLLADDMGLGKSAQAIAAAKEVGARSVYVVCPASLVENWRREFKRFWPEFDGELRVVSYNKVGVLPSSNVDVLILDEAHYLKNRGALRTQAVLGEKCDGRGGLVERAEHVFCLTGTPTPNDPSELWPIARAVFPEAIPNPKIPGKPLSYTPFVSRYCKRVNNGFGFKIVGGKNLGELKQRIAPFVLRRKKEEVLTDLPPIRFDTLALEGKVVYPPDARDEIWAVAKILDEKGVDGLKDIAPHVASLRRVTGLAKVGPVVEWMKDWFDSGGRKLVVFAQHRDVLDGMTTALNPYFMQREWYGARIDGSTNAKSRQVNVDQFQNDPECQVFLGNIQAAGTGLTLTAASDLLFVETSWVPADNQQAAMRIHRIGQRNACLVRVAALAGSIDEEIQKALLRKMKDIRSLWS